MPFALLASQEEDVVIDELITLGTPIQKKYSPGAGVKEWNNVYSTSDQVQTKPWGAERTSGSANNIEVKGYGHSELHTSKAWDEAFPKGGQK